MEKNNRDKNCHGNLKLLVILNVPVFYVKIEQSYSADYVNVLDYILTLGNKVNQLTIWLPVGKHKQGAVKFHVPPNVDIRPLPYYLGPFDLLRKGYKIIPSLLHHSVSHSIKKYNAVGIIAPSTIGFISAPIMHYVWSKPIFFIMRGYKRKTIQYEFQDRPFKREFAKIIVRFYDRLTQWMLRRRRVIMFTVGELEDTLGKEYSFTRDNIFALAPMVPKEMINDVRLIQSEVRDILYVGRLSGEKGISDLLTAFAEGVKEIRIPLTLHIVGSGPEEENLKRQADQLGIVSVTKFYGFLPRGEKLWNLFDRCQIFVLPSYTEGLPRALFEAMARGLAVVSTRVGGIPYKVKNEENGLLVEAGDMDGLKEAMLRLIRDRKLRESMIKKGYETALEVSFEEQRDRMLDIIEEHLLGGK